MHVASTHRDKCRGRYEAGSAASEAIEAEVSLQVWDVLHGTLRCASEADGPCETGLCHLRGHRVIDLPMRLCWIFSATVYPTEPHVLLRKVAIPVFMGPLTLISSHNISLS